MLQLQLQFQIHFRDVANSCYRETQNKETKLWNFTSLRQPQNKDL